MPIPSNSLIRDQLYVIAMSIEDVEDDPTAWIAVTAAMRELQSLLHSMYNVSDINFWFEIMPLKGYILSLKYCPTIALSDLDTKVFIDGLVKLLNRD